MFLTYTHTQIYIYIYGWNLKVDAEVALNKFSVNFGQRENVLKSLAPVKRDPESLIIAVACRVSHNTARSAL